MRVKRGPQLVQLVKGYPKRRSRGSRISRRQSPEQRLTSGGITASAPGRLSLARMRKSLSPGQAVLGHHRVDAGQGGRPAAEFLEENLKDAGRALHLDFHPPGGVAHPPGQVVAPGQAIDERPEAHALNQAADAQPFQTNSAGEAMFSNRRMLLPGAPTKAGPAFFE